MDITIGLFASSAEPMTSDLLRETAVATGRQLAHAGYRLLYGGTNVGLMGLVSGAAREAGGKVTGIIAQTFHDLGMTDNNVDELIVTKTLSERKRLMFQRSAGFLVLPGGIGTLDEFFEMLTYNVLESAVKPVVLVNAGGFYEPLARQMDVMANTGMISSDIMNMVHIRDTPAEAVRCLEAILNP